MKKLLFILLATLTLAVTFSACNTPKAYNKELKQIELGMHKTQVIAIMGNDYIEYTPAESWGNLLEKIEYRGRYKFNWFFEFKNGTLEKWYKEEATKK